MERLLYVPGGTKQVVLNAIGFSLKPGDALAVIGNRPAVLDAQSHLQAFYARYGFTVTGPEYVEDGIPHVPMRREP